MTVALLEQISYYITSAKGNFSCCQFHQTLPNLGLILGLGTSSIPYLTKMLGHIEPILSWDGLLVLTRDRINPSIL